MKHIINNTNQGVDTPWVTLDEEGVHYSGLIAEVSFTFGSVDSHTKAKTDAVVGDICYYGETPIGVVVIKGDDTVKIMSLFYLKNDVGAEVMSWSNIIETTNITDENNGKENTKSLVALGNNYVAANLCFLYTTTGTKQGDWYLPASLELLEMKLPSNIDQINNSLKSLNINVMGRNSIIWSSTESARGYARCLDIQYDGLKSVTKIYDHYGGVSIYVRAFCEL